MKVYKLTDKNGQTRNNTQWGPGESHEGTGWGRLCGPGWIHWYSHPFLAVLLNPLHADFSEPRLWEALAEGEILDDNGLKGGSHRLTTLREIPLPEITIEHRVRFAIFCTLEICEDSDFRTWADKWLSGEDRSMEAAHTMEAAGWGRQHPLNSISCEVALAARVVARAASAADAAARAATARDASEATTWAEAVEYASARVAQFVADSKSIDLIAIAERAVSTVNGGTQ